VLSGQTVVCFAPDPWTGLWRNRHQIMTRLAKNNTVIYVEPRVYLSEAIRKARRGQTRIADVRAPRLRRERDNLYLYKDPVYAPYAGRLSGGRITAAIRRTALRGALASLHATAPILWLLRPWHADQIGLYGEKLVVYHVTDEYSDYPTITDKAQFRRDEEALLRRADLVIVTSPALLSAKAPCNPNTHLVRNAVDYEGFQRALAAQGEHPAFRGLPRPRIGYAGALNEKIDFALVEALARSRPDWQFALVGSLDLVGDDGAVRGLRLLDNVQWTGRVPVEEVPAAISSMDVCLLPYKINPWTANIDSLKLYEYLACGKPVVATDVPAAREFAGLVRIATGASAFAAAVEDALTEDASACAGARKAVAAANTWDHRVTQIERLLAETIGRAA
jgi:glycosyltransferase involved in cell wall biosynthesis